MPSQPTALQQEMLQAGLDLLDQGMTVFDTDLRLVAWNRTFIELFNFPPHLAAVGTPLEAEIKRIVNDAHKEATRILTDHRDQLETVAQALIHYETLTGEEIAAIMRGARVRKKVRSRILVRDSPFCLSGKGSGHGSRRPWAAGRSRYRRPRAAFDYAARFSSSRFRISRATSAFSRRNSRALSLPWPIFSPL